MASFRGVGFAGSGGARTLNGGVTRFRDARGRYIRGFGGSIFDQIGPRLEIGPAVTRSAVEEVLQFYAEQVEEWMRENAPWNDVDTPHSYAGEARDGLRAEVVEHGPTTFTLTVYHTVDYGIWLEVRWNGRYAILRPAVEHWGPHLMQEMEVFQ